MRLPKGVQVVHELPPGKWQLAVGPNNVIVAASPEHPPRILYADGTFEEIQFNQPRSESGKSSNE